MLKQFKKSLRLTQTNPENVLWYNIRNRHMKKFKFRRQHILRGYIVDFVCLEKNLIIELDGSQHAEQQEYDAIRTRALEEEGFRIIRFWNNEVLFSLRSVLESIYRALEV